MKMYRLLQMIVTLAAISAAGSSFAQWIWVDEHGVKQFSDQAPPPNVPQNHILKQPHHTAETSTAVGDTTDAGGTDPAAKAPPTVAEQNADYNKRKQEQAAKAKKDAEEANRQAAKSENCARASNYLANLKSGVRVGTVDSNGERGYMSDDERAKEEARTQSVLDTTCQ
jgi:Domain of unknown function (DUF4124)